MVCNIKVTWNVQPESYYHYNHGCNKAALLKNRYRPSFTRKHTCA